MAGVVPRLPARRPATHKGDYGHVLVAAGSVGMTGAASLAAEAAMRSGAGLVTLACPAKAWPVLASQLREVMVRPVGPEHSGSWTLQAAAEVEELAGSLAAASAANSISGRTVLAVGPGMGRSDEALAAARRLAAVKGLPLVLDADGLVAFEGRAEELARRGAPTILTPHPGEAARLVGAFDGRDDDARRTAAIALARAAKAIVVLKGHRTVITDGERVELNRTGNPGMATGGAGDVLTGIIAGLLATGLEPFDAAHLGAHVHGFAGDLAAIDVGQTSLVAGDILSYLPKAFCKHQWG